MKVYLKSDCGWDFTRVALIHELGHTVDAMYNKYYHKNMTSSSDFSNYRNVYQQSKSNGNYNYLRDYAYTN